MIPIDITKLINIEAEQSVLGCCFIGGKPTVVEVQGIINSIDFYQEKHRVIWETLCRLISNGSSVDIITVISELGDYLEKVGGRQYLIELSNKAPNYKNVASYCKILKQKSIARQKAVQCQELVRKLEDEEDPFELISQSMIDDSMLLASNQKNEIIHVKDKAIEVFQKIEERKNNNGIVGLATGFNEFDIKVGGLRKGNLHILAARPAMGKTTLALNIASNVSMNFKKPVLFISLEMTNEQLIEKLMAEQAGLESWKLQDVAKMSSGEWKNLAIASNELYESKLYLDDSHRSKASEIAVRVRRFKSINPDLALVIVDYLQIMKAESRRDKNNEVGETSGILQGLAKELNIPVLALSQLSREVERREDKRPILSDLRDSGTLEQDGATVMFLYRDDYYNPNKYPVNNDPSETELIIAKNRFGPTGKLYFSFHKSKSRFIQLKKGAKPCQTQSERYKSVTEH